MQNWNIFEMPFSETEPGCFSIFQKERHKSNNQLNVLHWLYLKYSNVISLSYSPAKQEAWRNFYAFKDP